MRAQFIDELEAIPFLEEGCGQDNLHQSDFVSAGGGYPYIRKTKNPGQCQYKVGIMVTIEVIGDLVAQNCKRADEGSNVESAVKTALASPQI